MLTATDGRTLFSKNKPAPERKTKELTRMGSSQLQSMTDAPHQYFEEERSIGLRSHGSDRRFRGVHYEKRDVENLQPE